MFDLKTLEFNKILDILKGYCKTKYAQSIVSTLSPSEDYDEVMRLNNETKEAYQAVVKYGDIPLGGLYEVKDSINRTNIGGSLNEAELLDIVGLLDCSTNVMKYFKTLDGMKLELPSLKSYTEKLEVPQALKTSITLAITPDGKVSDNASRELFMIRRNITSLENRLRSKLNELLISKAGQLTEQLIVMRDGRMCLPVKIEYKNNFGGIVHDISSSNTTCYIEPQSTLETANQIDLYRAQEKKEVLTILKNLSLLVAADSDMLLQDLECLTSLDIIYAKALMAKELDYNEVNIKDNQEFNIKKAKHPLIAKEKVVPIDIEIGKKFDCIIITGPNTGGKTVALKTVGLLHLMVYSGMMVPASMDSEFGMFDSILVDIGDEQSIEQSLSTFSSHMTKVINIINTASFKSLVLIDELGSGTDPKEGSSLAIAIINHLKSYGSKMICTTHYSELKNYAYNNDRVCNASVEFNTNTLLPTYKILLGVPGKSNAIEIANRLGLNAKIIENAKNDLNSNLSNSSLLMNNLEEEMTNLRNKEAELEHKINQYNEMLNSLQNEKFNLSKQTNKIISDAKKEAKNVLGKAQEEAEALISEIKVMSSEAYKEHELASLKHKVRSLDVDETLEEDSYEFQEGDFVFVKSYEKYGTISKIKKDKYTVNIGQFQMDFKKAELQLSAKPKEKPKKVTQLSGYNPASHASLSLDLRGKRYEEVSFLMDQYLDQAILGNLECVTIIHGFGTGTIRNAVQNYLKNCPYVKSYRYGKEGEGLNGVTVVYLK
ncbi:MAG: endonuclease MutS2 [Erysipelotrichaceae bacterium]|nr:endonuclease MutS2 [Erysipelotrichaceae bacterium]